MITTNDLNENVKKPLLKLNTTLESLNQNKTGRWYIDKDDLLGSLRCSNCGYNGGLFIKAPGTNYCPNCGTKMKKLEGETN